MILLTTSFIKVSIEAGIPLSRNGVLHAMLHDIALERIKATAGSQADLAQTNQPRPDPV